MPDFGVIEDSCLLALVQELRKLVQDGSVLYVHCYGGHGRTGTVLVNLLQAVCKVDRREAMRMLSVYHRERKCGRCALNRGKLEDKSQEQQVERLQPVLYDRNKKIAK